LDLSNKAVSFQQLFQVGLKDIIQKQKQE
jgi:hypothetical protein